MRAGPPPAAWGGTSASGQSPQECQKQHIETNCARDANAIAHGMRNQMGARDAQRHQGRAKTMPAAHSRYNHAPDAYAIVHGMSNHLEAGPAPTAWRCTAASGQGEQLCPKWAVETTVPRMQVQVHMGCTTAWGQGQHLPHGGVHLHQGRASNYAKTAHRHNCAQDADQLRMGCATGWGQSAWDA